MNRDIFCLAHCVNANTTQRHDGNTFVRTKLLGNTLALDLNDNPHQITRQKSDKRRRGENMFFGPQISHFFWRAVTAAAGGRPKGVVAHGSSI